MGIKLKYCLKIKSKFNANQKSDFPFALTIVLSYQLL